MAKFKKIQGESLALTKGVSIDGVEQDFAVGWTCKVEIKSESGGLGGVADIAKTITELNEAGTRFIIRVTPAEMASLSVGNYHLVTDISNAANEFNDEIQDKLVVSEQGIV